LLVEHAGKLDLFRRLAAQHLVPARCIVCGELRQLDWSTAQDVTRQLETVGIRPPARLHRQQAAERKRQREDAKDDATVVMPAHRS
jgi:hypothetical protein